MNTETKYLILSITEEERIKKLKLKLWIAEKKNEKYEIAQLKRRINDTERYLKWRTIKIKSELHQQKKTLDDTETVAGLRYKYNKKAWNKEVNKLIEKPSIYKEIEEQIRRWKEQEEF